MDQMMLDAPHKESPRRATDGRRPHPWPSRGVLAAAVGVVYGALLLFNVVVSLGPPRLSLVVAVPAAGSARVHWVLPNSMLWERGVRTGTPVLALDGRAPALRDAGPWIGQRLTVRLPGTGATTISAVSIRANRVSWPLLVLSPWFFLLGTLVLLRSPRLDLGRATYLLCTSAAVALALAPAAIGDVALAAAVEFAAVTLFPACFVFFCLTFPVRHGGVTRTLVFAPPLAVTLLYLAALVVLPDVYAVAALLRLAILLVYLLIGAGLLVYSFVTGRDGETRRGLLIIGAGAAASVLPFLLIYVTPALLHRPPILAPEQAILGLALLPLSLTYAILRFRALDMRLLQRWLVHGLLGGALVAVFAAVAVWTQNWSLDDVPEPERSLLLSTMLGVLAIVLFGGVYGRARHALDKLIFKDRYEYREALQAMSQDLMARGDVDGVGAALTGSIRRLMNLEFAVLLVRNAKDSLVSGSAGAGDSALLSALRAAAAREDDGAGEERVEALTDRRLPVTLIPLHTHESIVGHLCLGPKASGEPYGADDRALVATLSGHLAAIVRNIQLVAALRTTIDDLHTQQKTVALLNAALEQTREEERTRLAADLHDEPLQTALDIQRRLAAAHLDSPLTAIYSARLQTLIDQLRALCIRMRPAALDQLGLHAALDMLAMDVSERSNVAIGLSPSTEIDGLTLSPAAELVLYRAAQEALTNSLRHGQPREIMITLQRRDDMMRLCVRDDGAGFTVPARLDDLVENGHLGMAGLDQRVRYAGGQLAVTSHVGQGTIVQVDVPLESHEGVGV